MLSRASTSLIRASLSLSLFSLAATSALAGPDWVERGDAGSFYFSAQAPRRPLGATTLNTVSGSLATGVGVNDYEDLYFIRVTDPAAFSVAVDFADFNAVLFLFDITVNNELFGRLANDDNGETNLPFINGPSTDGTNVIITRPGDYIVGVTGLGRTAFSRSGPIFSLATTTEISGPDGTGGINPLDRWEGIGQQGNYRLRFTATDFPLAPAPGAATLAIIGLACTAARRRR